MVVETTGRASPKYTVFIPYLQNAGAQNDKVTIPKVSDWVDYGTILTAGPEGAWDHFLYGGFAATAVKKDGIYYLYYQGAEDYSNQLESVTRRAIGVATSPDGINFTKYNNNPVLTWLPTGHLEEGAVSSGVTVVGDEIFLYYGANTTESPTTINADGRLAISDDGLNFVDQGIALDHEDPSIWGSGDELFPIATIHDAGQWIVYYLPNSRVIGRKLGVAWGDERDELSHSAAVRSGISSINAWGTAGKAKVGPKTYAIFTNWVTNPRTEVRLMSLDAPDRLSNPVEVYRFDDFSQATVLLDEESNTWFMYYRNSDASAYGVKLAPAGQIDTTPPTAPTNVTALAVSDNQADLFWEPSSDEETGIVQYKLLWNGEYLATVKGLKFSDTDLNENTEYTYSLSAVNYHGIEGPPSSVIAITTLKR